MTLPADGWHLSLKLFKRTVLSQASLYSIYPLKISRKNGQILKPDYWPNAVEYCIRWVVVLNGLALFLGVEFTQITAYCQCNFFKYSKLFACCSAYFTRLSLSPIKFHQAPFLISGYFFWSCASFFYLPHVTIMTEIKKCNHQFQ